MGKVSPVSSKYIINTKITIEGSVDKPDVIGAVFGQTEGLLGSELELRELQRSGKIGRIEVKLETHNGKAQGYIIIPSSLDQVETAIIAAALETIERIGPCNSHVVVESIEDVRISKRNFVVSRAKDLLHNFKSHVMPDSHEMAEEVSKSVRVKEITTWGPDALPCGPSVEESDEVILVEGRADVVNLLKYGIKNAVALNGTSVPPSIADLCKEKSVTVFVDGDRGGDLIVRELQAVAEIDYVTRAPDGKELEELHMALRSRVAAAQYQPGSDGHGRRQQQPLRGRKTPDNERKEQRETRDSSPRHTSDSRTNESSSRNDSFSRLGTKERRVFKDHLFDLIGTHGAYLLDKDSQILGKIPLSELESTMHDVSDVTSVVIDGVITTDLVKIAERNKVQYLVATESKAKSNRVKLVTQKDLE